MKRVAIIQSNYIPWKGYFDIINDVDLFIFYDNVQYTKNDWRNRNKIQTLNGMQWLTIPTGGNINRMISEVKIENTMWQKKHLTSILLNYARAPYYNKHKEFFEHLYMGKKYEYLSEVNQYFIKEISKKILNIKTEFRNDREFQLSGKGIDRLINLLMQTGATEYVTGPAAKNYISEELFRKAEIKLVYKDYSGYPAYKQISDRFEHGVSIVDMIFNLGNHTSDYIWGWRNQNG